MPRVMCQQFQAVSVTWRDVITRTAIRSVRFCAYSCIRDRESACVDDDGFGFESELYGFTVRQRLTPASGEKFQKT